MIYRFKSQATADTIMLPHTGEQLLKIMGKELTPQGIITVAQIPAAIEALDQAVLDSEANGGSGAEAPAPAPSTADNDQDPALADPVRLRQRAAPLIAMLKESAAAHKDVVWGV